VKDLAKVIAGFDGRRVVVVGDVMLDTTVRGVVTRISPEAPVPVLESAVTEYAAGGAANVARNIRALGGSPALFGAVGLDAEGARLRRLLHQLDVEDGLMEDPLRPTTVKTRIVAQNQQIVRVDRESREPLDPRAVHALRDRIRLAIQTADAVVISDYAKGVLVPALVRPALAAAAGVGMPVVVDPKHVAAAEYSGATVLTPNRKELAQMTGERLDAMDDEALVVAAGSVVSTLALDAVLITCGADGMIVVSKSGNSVPIAAHTHEAYDSTGAGDTVTAAVALALAAGAPIVEAAHVASAAAGMAVTKAGTAAVFADELLSAVGRSRQRRRAAALD
jgi:D-beta-D-heptose 7-phosphate kinase/D-beta-D-heptose 1-phosphate adenosyltransferase